MGFNPGKEGCESAGDGHYPCVCDVMDHRNPPTPQPQSSARTESVGENSFSGTPYMNVESWREEPGVYSSSTHREQSYFQFLTRTLGHILQLSPDESPSDWLNPWCALLMCQLCPATEKKKTWKPSYSHQKENAEQFLFVWFFYLNWFLFVHLSKSSSILFHKVPP